ncbi:nitroreductase [Clostridium carboxidivorans P7]|uniref:Nitroreductase n=1 Tax=Clostridium carboxidivorans P7 TaxID=536227 RepID=C6PZ42_9CLOT|nr:nitroreductase family protein [Clostridium carboxidivorans]AKN30933.1 nitroreductase [Clostridium carboxidivorans P7]EET85484.1 nitroreductase [Clostridium carboxidivorans P7]EFG88814.1 4Fe-4S binding domain protein [Clostridium carboxidivorans P7]
MMNVNTEKCIGCGECIKDCFIRDIEMVNGKAKINNKTCIKCGHCIAICPKNAVSTDEYDMKEVKEFTKEEFLIDPDNLLNFIKFRRTVRQFKDKEVEMEKINKIIEAGRFTQTASNMQDVSYIVVREKIEELKELVFEGLKNKGQNILDNLNSDNIMFKRYAIMWLNMYDAYKKDPKQNDSLFFNAPLVIIVTARLPFNGALAASNMELVTDALGLGTLFSGFFLMAAKDNKEINDLLGIKKGTEIAACMIIGYPDVKYLRTVPRKAVDVTWT